MCNKHDRKGPISACHRIKSATSLSADSSASSLESTLVEDVIENRIPDITKISKTGIECPLFPSCVIFQFSKGDC